MIIQNQRHYGVWVKTNVEMDFLRREQCLCFNCKNADAGCDVAQKLYEVCKEHNVATMITRCPTFDYKK